MFYKNGLTVNDLKKLVDEAIANGYGKATIMVQAVTDCVSDIVINGFEGYGNESSDFDVFSFVSVKDEKQYRDIYGDPEE